MARTVEQMIEMQEAVWAGTVSPDEFKTAIGEIINSSEVDLVAFILALVRNSSTLTEHDVADMMEAELNKPLPN